MEQNTDRSIWGVITLIVSILVVGGIIANTPMIIQGTLNLYCTISSGNDDMCITENENILHNNNFEVVSTIPNGSNKHPNVYADYWGGYSGNKNVFSPFINKDKFNKNVYEFNQEDGNTNKKEITQTLTDDQKAKLKEGPVTFVTDTFATGQGALLRVGISYHDKSGVKDFHDGWSTLSGSSIGINGWHRGRIPVGFTIDNADFEKEITFHIVGSPFTLNTILYVRTVRLGFDPLHEKLSRENLIESDKRTFVGWDTSQNKDTTNKLNPGVATFEGGWVGINDSGIKSSVKNVSFPDYHTKKATMVVIAGGTSVEKLKTTFTALASGGKEKISFIAYNNGTIPIRFKFAQGSEITLSVGETKVVENTFTGDGSTKNYITIIDDSPKESAESGENELKFIVHNMVLTDENNVYLPANVEITQNIEVKEWFTHNATRIKAVGGARNTKYRYQIPEATKNNGNYEVRVKVKNNGTKPVIVAATGYDSVNAIVQPGKSSYIYLKDIVGDGNKRLGIDFKVSDINDIIDITVYEPLINLVD